MFVAHCIIQRAGGSIPVCQSILGKNTSISGCVHQSVNVCVSGRMRHEALCVEQKSTT